MEPDMRAALEWGFDAVLDEDKSGFIEVREGQLVARYLGYGAGENGTPTSQMWSEMDANKDGRISKDEYCNFMGKKLCNRLELALQLKNELATKKAQWEALRHAAAEADVELEEELLDGPSVAAAPAATASAAAGALKISKEQRAALEKRFKGLDTDSSGEITKAELVDALLLDDESEVDQLWASADTDGDGKITFEEFARAADAFAGLEAELDTGELPGM